MRCWLLILFLVSLLLGPLSATALSLPGSLPQSAQLDLLLNGRPGSIPVNRTALFVLLQNIDAIDRPLPPGSMVDRAVQILSVTVTAPIAPSPPPPTQTVPEPGAPALVALGLLALVAARRGRRLAPGA